MEKSTPAPNATQPQDEAQRAIDACLRELVAAGCDESVARAAMAEATHSGTREASEPAPAMEVQRGAFTPSTIYPADLGALLRSADDADALSAARMSDTAPQAGESLLRGLSGLGGLLWAAAVGARDSGEPISPTDIADVGELVGHLARAVSALHDLQSNCRMQPTG